MNKQIERLADLVQEAKIITYYTGAGTSTESGIPDYRSELGRWTVMKKNNMDPVYFANKNRITEDPEKFFADRQENHRPPQPNTAHYILAEMEKNGKDIRVITQNVDGLFQKAGHRYVLELHGNHRAYHCMDCGREYLVSELERDEKKVPRCYVDGGIVRPNVVYFGENADPTTVAKARGTLRQSDLLIIAGTSLSTPLAKRLLDEYRGDEIVVINTDLLDFSPIQPTLYIQEKIGTVIADMYDLLVPENTLTEA